MMWVLAYGEYHTFDYWGMFFETLPPFLGGFFIPLTLYAGSTLLTERSRYPILGIVVYTVVFARLLPELGVMGAYGPGHVALAVTTPIWPLLWLVLLVKTVIYYTLRYRERRCGAAAPDAHSRDAQSGAVA